MSHHDYLEQFEKLLNLMVSLNASDLHCSLNTAPVMRIHGLIEEQTDYERFDQNTLNGMVEAVLSSEQLAHLKTQRSCDLGYSSNESQRFRLNIYYERGNLALAIRWLEGEFHSFEKLKLPPQIREVVGFKDGLVLVTGATGSGKSTTLASIINEINKTRPCHILTIEDPIEFIHSNQTAVVHQREVGQDVPSFADAIRSAMREDPDVVLLGEMRDLETMHAAITAAETGHLVFATLHTNDAISTVDRLLDMGAESFLVASSLQAVLAQRLVRK
ncbi:MAG: PilT/PilU family type 4a pilus ATPase, partial [Gammaproteobacteria bacterium]|nr:PilT/PilU family type 4a pilus ATPase [Gammaproteobacteria bacterium]